jgi:hypothetical protein
VGELAPGQGKAHARSLLFMQIEVSDDFEG